ncbi:glycerophosphodiester phosphodiesterase family protein [Winogradskyella flava]|uniref:glycerophosphodiester phosphodiesterase family protein n=1 Tax=Winogradskyella flava TaxID=1884876 RepID=UPI002492B42D|nr:glycerophosphodiester phosphodiesterase family protein [Winogradskyella flava]
MEIICYSCGRGENPENTILGIRHCQNINPDWRIEMDVQITADNHLVLFHDYSTKRTTDEDKLINELNLKEVKTLNAGYNFEFEGNYLYRLKPIKVPELLEVFTNFPKAKLLLDIHTNNLKVINVLINLIETEFNNGDFVIVSEYDIIIKELKKKKPNWIFGASANEAKKMLYSSFLYLDSLFPVKSDILMLPKKYNNINVLSRRVMNHTKKRNIPIWAWMYEGEYVKTVESKNEIEAFEKMGIKGVFVEYPQKILNEIT